MNTQLILLVGNHAISRRRKAVALVLAWVMDGLRLLGGGVSGWNSPVGVLADVAAAIILIWLAGLRWQVLAAFAMGLLPGIAIFPTWTALAATLPVVASGSTPAGGNPVVWEKGGVA